MSFKEKFFQKLLNKNQSYNYYKSKYDQLNEDINNCQNEIVDLKKQLEIGNNQLNGIKHSLFNLEEGFIFSIVIAVYNTEKYLSDAIESIINQTFNFDKVQIILVDDGSTDNSGKICLDYVTKFPENIFYIYQENKGQANARNNGLDFCKGKYINFLDSDDKLELNALEEVYYHFIKFKDEIDVVSIPRYLFGAVEGPMKYHNKFHRNRIVDIYEEYDFPQVSISAAFIKKSALLEKFDERVVISEDSLLINSIILKKCKFGVVGSTRYLYRKRHEQNSTIDSKKINHDYFNTRMKYYFKNLINISIKLHGVVLKYIQVVLMYDLQWLFLQNTEKDVLSDDEKIEFYNHIFDVIQVVDDDIIFLDSFNLNKFYRYCILNFKYSNSNFEIKSLDDEVILFHQNKKFDVLSNFRINIRNIDKKDDHAVIKGFLNFYPFDVNITAYSNDVPLKIIFDRKYGKFCMDSPVSVKLKFETTVLLNQVSNIKFEVNIGSNSFISKLNYSKLKSNVDVEKNEYSLRI